MDIIQEKEKFYNNYLQAIKEESDHVITFLFSIEKKYRAYVAERFRYDFLYRAGFKTSYTIWLYRPFSKSSKDIIMEIEENLKYLAYKTTDWGKKRNCYNGTYQLNIKSPFKTQSCRGRKYISYSHYADYFFTLSCNDDMLYYKTANTKKKVHLLSLKDWQEDELLKQIAAKTGTHKYFLLCKQFKRLLKFTNCKWSSTTNQLIFCANGVVDEYRFYYGDQIITENYAKEIVQTIIRRIKSERKNRLRRIITRFL